MRKKFHLFMLRDADRFLLNVSHQISFSVYTFFHFVILTGEKKKLAVTSENAYENEKIFYPKITNCENVWEIKYPKEERNKKKLFMER